MSYKVYNKNEYIIIVVVVTYFTFKTHVCIQNAIVEVQIYSIKSWK